MATVSNDIAISNAPGSERPGVFARILDWAGPRAGLQALLFVSIAALLALLSINIIDTMQRAGIRPGFGFLWRSANFEIGESLISYAAGASYFRALLAGFLNTLKVAIFGCVLATVFGILFGVARLSPNRLLAGMVKWFIEVVRNTPLLLQLFFWISTVQALPGLKQALSLNGFVFLSNRGIFFPALLFQNGVALPFAGLALLLGSGLLAFVSLANANRRTGVAAALAFALALIVIFASVSLELPELAGFRFKGGWSVTPEFAALLVGLVVKFAASIAENVRTGIQAVKAGQWEAARALGFTNGRIIRLIVLPQALRIITPLTTSNYLDLIKDSSLAVAIGYPDLVNIANTTANTTGQAFEALTIIIAVYLTINLSVSLLMNQYNKRVALRGGVPS